MPVFCGLLALKHNLQDVPDAYWGSYDGGDSSAKDGEILCQCLVCCLNT